MPARGFILAVTLAAVGAAGGYRWHAQRTQAQLAADATRLVAAAAEQRRLHEEDSKRLAAAQRDWERLQTERSSRPPAAAPASVDVAPSSKAPLLPANPAAVTLHPELRRWQVQAFVSEQRLRFAALLQRLNFTAEKQQAFDRIQGACQEVLLDEAQTAATRQQARQARDAQLQELFGVHYEQWLEANRNEPARAVVAQIVQQTFQGSGALTTGQADELTRIVAQHRLPPSREAGAGQPGYDWDRIVADAQTLLAERQQEDFRVAIEFRRASEKMSAMATKKKP